MNLIDRFVYRPLERVTYPSGARHYICPDSGRKLPSVTTVIGATADKTGLNEWRQRIGDKKADIETKEAAAIGSLMHTYLEKHITEQPRPGGNNYIRVLAGGMADQIIHRGLPQVDEVWGSEVALYSPELFAGTTDLVGTYKGLPAIMDFKTTKKMKTREMDQVQDYFLQLTAYAMAHNELFGTDIRTGVIFMVSRDGDYEEFVIEHDEFQACQTRFLARFEQFITTPR